MERPDDKWLRLVGIPLGVLLSNLLFLEEVRYSPAAYLVWSGVGILLALVLWEGAVRWLMYTRRRYAAIGQTGRRVLVTFAGYLLITVVVGMAFVSVADRLAGTHAGQGGVAAYTKRISVWFAGVLLTGLVFETIYYLQKYREAVQEAESVKKTTLQSQYDSLKNQVNPHFLFNALNSLSALIAEDRTKATLFLDELSSVYRYLLQAD